VKNERKLQQRERTNNGGGNNNKVGGGGQREREIGGGGGGANQILQMPITQLNLTYRGGRERWGRERGRERVREGGTMEREIIGKTVSCFLKWRFFLLPSFHPSLRGEGGTKEHIIGGVKNRIGRQGRAGKTINGKRGNGGNEKKWKEGKTEHAK
jgi:hypothetical protein